LAKPNLEVVKISDSREIHVQANEYKGRVELDIRTYIKTQQYTGYTQKGVRIPTEKGAELIEAISKVLELLSP